jgi:D-sedoheptulose 7-phosphate isomerase
MADVDLVVPGESTARIQEAHKFLLHVLCEIVEERLSKSR